MITNSLKRGADMATKHQFLREYIKAIREGNAAVFAGAGLSRSSGFVVWKELLRPMAEDIGLNIDDEHDLTAVAQYVRNKSGNRAAINSAILEAFSKNVEVNENVTILTRLPIYTYWTTNYDHLLEEGLLAANRNSDVKIDYKQLSYTKRDRDAIVYKMHGDVDHAADAVLTKDDYVQYDRNHPFFRSVLQGDLISKTFLFIGFSFEDPNLDSILSQIRLLLDDHIRNHYCFMKRVKQTTEMTAEEFGYQKARQDLREEDLKRYGIQTVFIDDYSEITQMLREIEIAIRSNNVFISGSADFFNDNWTKVKIERLAYKLSNKLVKEGFKVSSGFGVGIGSSVINGALDEIYGSRFKHMDEHMCLRPFPQGIMDEDERKAKWRKYRESILSENGIAIFIMGNKKNYENEKVIADGCLQEFEIAKEYNCSIIPIGCTGDAAAKIYDAVKEDVAHFSYLEHYMDLLGTESDIDKIVDSVIEIAKTQRIIQ